MNFLIRLFCSHEWQILVHQDEYHLDDVIMTCSKCGKLKKINRPHSHIWKLEDKTKWKRTDSSGGKLDYFKYVYICEICGTSKIEEI